MPLQGRNQIWQSLEEGAGKRCSECALDRHPVIGLGDFPSLFLLSNIFFSPHNSRKGGRAGARGRRGVCGRGGRGIVPPTPKLQTLVYDILPSTTAVFSYAIGSRKLSANEQFLVGAQTVVSLLQTTQIISDVCFITDLVAYTSSNKTKSV